MKTAYAALPDRLEYRLATTWPEAAAEVDSNQTVCVTDLSV